MFTIIRCRIFYLPIGYPKRKRLRCTELPFCLLFCMGVKHWGRNMSEGDWEWGAQENIWVWDGRGNRGMATTTWWGASHRVFLGDQIEKRWAGHVAGIRETRGVNRVFWGGKSEGKGPLERPRRRLEDNIKMDFQEVGWRAMDLIELAQDRDRWQALVNAVLKFRVP